MSKVTVLDFRGRIRTMDRKYADILCAIGKAEYVDDATVASKPEVQREMPDYSRRVLTAQGNGKEQYQSKNQARRERGRGR